MAGGVAPRVWVNETEGQTGANRWTGKKVGFRGGDVIGELRQGAVGPSVYRDVRREGRRGKLIGPGFCLSFRSSWSWRCLGEESMLALLTCGTRRFDRRAVA